MLLKALPYHSPQQLISLDAQTKDGQSHCCSLNRFDSVHDGSHAFSGVVAAAKNLGVSIPIVARLEGTNVEEGRRVLHDSGINILTASDMRDAAEKVVSAANAEF